MLQKRKLSQRAAAPTQVFDNNQPTMVRKRQKLTKQAPTRAQPSRAKVKNAILQTHKKNSNHQPPPASRHRSVLKLDCLVPSPTFPNLRAR
jgi:hypothetical protein